MRPKNESLQNRLSATLKQEDNKINQRFKEADSILLPKEEKKAPAAEIQQQSRIHKIMFSFLEEDNNTLESLILRSGRLSMRMNNSEIVRAGLQALLELQDDEFIKVLSSVPKRKRGKQSI